MAVITVTADVPADPQTPTRTYYQDLVNQVMGAFDQITTTIPKLLEAQASSAQSVRANLSVPDAFCNAAIVAVEQYAEIQAMGRLRPERARNLLEFFQAFTPLSDKVEVFSKRLRHALRAAKSEVATDSLNVYRLVRTLASDRRSPAFDALAGVMKRDLARKSPSKAEREELRKRKLQEEVELLVAERLKEVKLAA